MFLKNIKDETGQAVVEFAITLLLLMGILCGIIDFGWVYYNQLTINNYCREATRYAVVSYNNETETDYKTKIKTRLNNIVPTRLVDKIDVLVDFSNDSSPENGDIKVDLTYMIPSLTYITRPLAVDGKIQIKSELTMRME